MWAHKPHTKRKSQEGIPVSQLQQGGSVHKASPNNHDIDYYRPNPKHSGEGRQHLGQFRDDQNRKVPLPPRVREEDQQKLEREVNNTPAWMAKRSKTTTCHVNKPTKPPAFLFSAVCFNTGQTNRVRPMPINIDNSLPTIAMRFGISDEK